MSGRILIILSYFLVISIVYSAGYGGGTRRGSISTDPNDSNNTPLKCGSIISIKHHSSNSCLTVYKISNKEKIKQHNLIYSQDKLLNFNNHFRKQEIPLLDILNLRARNEKCDINNNINQLFLFKCCDITTFNCTLNDNINLKSTAHYDTYFQLESLAYQNNCLSTTMFWKNARDNELLLFSECQGSFNTMNDCGINEMKMQRDKWSFNSWERNDEFKLNNLIQIENVKCPGCIGLNKDKSIFEGYSCNTGLSREGNLEFKLLLNKNQNLNKFKTEL